MFVSNWHHVLWLGLYSGDILVDPDVHRPDCTLLNEGIEAHQMARGSTHPGFLHRTCRVSLEESQHPEVMLLTGNGVLLLMPLG